MVKKLREVVCLLILWVLSGVCVCIQLTFCQQKEESREQEMGREGGKSERVGSICIWLSLSEESKQIIRRVTRHPRPVFHRPIVWLFHFACRDCARAPSGEQPAFLPANEGIFLLEYLHRNLLLCNIHNIEPQKKLK